MDRNEAGELVGLLGFRMGITVAGFQHEGKTCDWTVTTLTS